MTTPYLLTFEPLLLEKVWGGDRLSQLGKDVALGAKIGESWEVADLSSTSSGGAGGGAMRSVISRGGLAGRTLGDAMRAWGQGLLGGARASEDGGFPLLVKYLDAAENLSVQVHPSPAYAAAHPGARLKTECWYILDAEPGAVIYKGMCPGVTRERFERDIALGVPVSDIAAVPAIAGECHVLPSGTCHALGAGVLVAEVQTPSDTTFRVYDWGRAGRELHIRESLECIDFSPAPHATCRGGAEASATLVRNQFFTLVEHAIGAGTACRPLDAQRCAAVMWLGGTGVARAQGDTLDLVAGQTFVVPASLSEGFAIEAASDAVCLVAHLRHEGGDGV
ncbi:MAG: class I mannose-6-phosphate isomerase [Phycisphaeraceae bacterium]|nr:class I mannose-6-phosphate isomerase [Phycisphaeraceae bacterium]